ncbi:expressed unknown protein [Seminavis robusta]|uniref:Uncharacterized protein n=1 Tax=Seminavis robusta TaxID=568900 RepID=A0A9N8HJ54_9STRA|nr:expressed unknown protein [Seminavis robusta]|eukprot:Sro637_g179410.1 n/a (128) ;mRNA; r:20450-20833
MFSQIVDQVPPMKSEMIDMSALSEDCSMSKSSSRRSIKEIVFGRRKTRARRSTSFPETLKKSYQMQIDEEIATLKKDLQELTSLHGPLAEFQQPDDSDRTRTNMSASWTAFRLRRWSSSSASLTPTV